MEITVYAYTDRGGRAVNEDALAQWIEGDRGVFVLADGLGGHSHGEVASHTLSAALTGLLRDWLESGAPLEAGGMGELFQNANDILVKQQRERGTMLTTAVALAIRGGQALWGHVGDSRLYCLSGGKIVSVTADHSVTYKKYLAGEIPFNGINVDEDRCALLQALGTKERCCPEIPDAPRALTPGDAFLLCSDGLWEYVLREEIEADWRSAPTAEGWGGLLVRRRRERAEPGSDNFSLLTVSVSG